MNNVTTTKSLRNTPWRGWLAGLDEDSLLDSWQVCSAWRVFEASRLATAAHWPTKPFSDQSKQQKKGNLTKPNYSWLGRLSLSLSLSLSHTHVTWTGLLVVWTQLPPTRLTTEDINKQPTTAAKTITIPKPARLFTDKFVRKKAFSRTYKYTVQILRQRIH